MSINEEAACQQYLLNLLEADSTMDGLVQGVWLRSVPQSEPFPVVKIHRVWNDMTFLVRGIVHWRGSGQPDWTDARAIGDRIDTLLHNKEGQDTTVAVHSFREESHTDEQLEAGDLFLSVGGIYRARARAV